MSFTTELSGDFYGFTRRRGAQHFLKGRIYLEAGSATRVVAKVRDPWNLRRYTVKLNRKGHKITASCPCRYFKINACDHAWAAILSAASSGLLQSNRPNGKARLVRARGWPRLRS